MKAETEFDFYTSFTDYLAFDFGSETSPVMDGYTRVNGTCYYALGLGYGWDEAVSERDRAVGDNFTRDFHQNSNDRNFTIDVPIGVYQVNATLGDASYAKNNVYVYCENFLIAENINTTAGEFLSFDYAFNCTDATVEFYFHNPQSTDWACNGITVKEGVLDVEAWLQYQIDNLPTPYSPEYSSDEILGVSIALIITFFSVALVLTLVRRKRKK